MAQRHEEDIDWQVPSASGERLLPPSMPGRSNEVPRLEPLWQIRSVAVADDELIAEALHVTQLRSHCVAIPPSASFKDAARFLSYVACATDGLGHRHNVHAPMPSPPLLTMTTRTMLETPRVVAALQELFQLLVTGVANGVPVVHGTTFRTFFTMAIRVLTKDLIPELFCDAIAASEWRGARSHSSVSAVHNHGGVIPFPSFAEKLVTLALLFVSNGFAFVTPVALHVLVALTALREPAQQAAAFAVNAENKASALVAGAAPSPPGPMALFQGNVDGRRLDGASAVQVPGGFLPPSRPLTYTGASVATDSTRPVRWTTGASRGGTATFVNSGRTLPLILTRRQVDSFAPPADMSDGAVGSSVTVSRSGASSAKHSPRPYSVTTDINAVALRKALFAHELYPTKPRSSKPLPAIDADLAVDSAGSAAVNGTIMAVTVPRQAGGASSSAIQRGVRGGFRTSAITKHVPWRCVEMDMFSRGAGSKPGDVVDNVVELDGVRMIEDVRLPTATVAPVVV